MAATTEVDELLADLVKAEVERHAAVEECARYRITCVETEGRVAEIIACHVAETSSLKDDLAQTKITMSDNEAELESIASKHSLAEEIEQFPTLKLERELSEAKRELASYKSENERLKGCLTSNSDETNSALISLVALKDAAVTEQTEQAFEAAVAMMELKKCMAADAELTLNIKAEVSVLTKRAEAAEMREKEKSETLEQAVMTLEVQPSGPFDRYTCLISAFLLEKIH